MTDSLFPVLVGACLCPGTPHEDGDFVHLRRKLGLRAGIELQQLVIEGQQNRVPSSVVTGQLSEGWLMHGIAEWNLVDENGPIPLNLETIYAHLLNDFERSRGLADAAADLYTEPVLGPLFPKAERSSNTTLTNGSTSAPRAGRPKPRRPSKRSSTSTTPTPATTPTSP